MAPASGGAGVSLDLDIAHAWPGSGALSVAAGLPDTGVTVLLGPSGAGKSTLLRLVAGLLRPDRGTVSWRGAVWHDGARRRHVPYTDRPVGMVFQDLALFDHLSVAENVGFGAGVGPGDVAAWLDRIGLTHAADRPCASLSGGERQRVALARTLAVRPELVLLDEPFTALDPDRRRQVRRLSTDLMRDAGAAAVLVSHDVTEARELADTVAVMIDGCLRRVGPRGQVFDDPRTAAVARALGWRNVHPPAAVAPWMTPPAGAAGVAVAAERVRLDLAGDDAAVVRIVDAGPTVEIECRAADGTCWVAVRPWDAPVPTVGARVGLVLRPQDVRPLEDR